MVRGKCVVSRVWVWESVIDFSFQFSDPVEGSTVHDNEDTRLYGELVSRRMIHR